MSKHRKHREAASEPKTPTTPTARPASTGTNIFSRTTLPQLLAIVGLSCVLGFTFNSASPIGVRFNQPATTTPPTPSKITAEEKTAISAPPTNVAVAATSPRPAPQPKPPLPTPPVTPPAPVPPVQSPTNPVAVVAPPPVPGQPNPAPIHWPETKALVAAGRAVLADVRHKALFDTGHIPGATSLPEMSSPDEFKAFLSRQPADMIVIVYCSSTSCSQSARVAARLVTEFHWPAVRYMTGGYAEYQQAELAKPAPQPAPPAP